MMLLTSVVGSLRSALSSHEYPVVGVELVVGSTTAGGSGFPGMLLFRRVMYVTVRICIHIPCPSRYPPNNNTPQLK